MPQTRVSVARTSARKSSQPRSLRRSIRPTSCPDAFAAAPTEASPWSMKLATTLARFRKLAKPGRAMPGNTSVTRIGRLPSGSLQKGAEDAGLGVPGERRGEAARQRVALVVADRRAQAGVGERAVHALAVGEQEVRDLGRDGGRELGARREARAGEIVDAEEFG